MLAEKSYGQKLWSIHQQFQTKHLMLKTESELELVVSLENTSEDEGNTEDEITDEVTQRLPWRVLDC